MHQIKYLLFLGFYTNPLHPGVSGTQGQFRDVPRPVVQHE